MRAQIEPHFLFNALANVKRLCRDDVDAGITMLRQPRALPSRRVAADARRAVDAGAGGGVSSVAYFGVLKVRMGARLRHVIDIPARARRTPVSVDDAADAGRERDQARPRPDPEGRHRGHPRACDAGPARGLGRRRRRRLRGACRAGGSGIGLANTRARLGALFGGAGSLALAPNAPSGVVATLRMPLQGRDAAHGHGCPAMSPITALDSPRTSRCCRRSSPTRCTRCGPSCRSSAAPATASRRCGSSSRSGRRCCSSTSRCPGSRGLEVAKQATPHAHIVFVTAYDQYAIGGVRPGCARLRGQAAQHRRG